MMKKAFLATCLFAILWLTVGRALETQPINQPTTPTTTQEPVLNETNIEIGDIDPAILDIIDLPDPLSPEPELTIKQKLKLLLEYAKIEALEAKEKIETHLSKYKAACLTSIIILAGVLTACLATKCCKKDTHEKPDKK